MLSLTLLCLLVAGAHTATQRKMSPPLDPVPSEWPPVVPHQECYQHSPEAALHHQKVENASF